MRKLLLVLLLSSASYAGEWTVAKNGITQGASYTSDKTAILAAVYLSQACKCEVHALADYKINAKVDVSISSSSSSSSAPYILSAGGAILKWQHPAQRENNAALSVTEIAGYKIRYKLPSSDYAYIDIKDNQTLQYDYNQNAVSLTFEIAAITKDGLMSDFTVMTKQ